MIHIFAPEFRGNIDRYFIRPVLRADCAIFALSLLAILIIFSASGSALALAEKQKSFLRIASTDCAAMFTLRDIDGREHTLASQEGRPVAVHFFATWCEPCKAEFGTLRQFFEARSGKFGILAVSVGEVPSPV